MSPLIDVFTVADTARATLLAVENRRLRNALAQAEERLAAYDQRLDYLQRRSERMESKGFKPRPEVLA